ncbi:Bifunctional trehalose-6-phosphate synthase/phosphatase [Orchesella cincta]|uniref:Bifunctional trehalose-6-phosphate synthase/phosphatase n=1 Tax=Orchesella cincta TaxID=48709 RepID=A0A1D2NH19_ORCCI|nr:Bifunctional trehalose-6-phosphate synthase/phosphatase [Orchesella cincta]
MNFKASGSLIVVSNRLPFVLKYNEESGSFDRKSSAGGLVTAVAPVVAQCGGIWIGWSGLYMEELATTKLEIPESDPADKTPTAGIKSKQIVAVNVDKEIFQQYYNGCCNGTFWPLFHSMSDRAIFSAESWEAYVQVNQEFAESTLSALRRLNETPESDANIPLVWIHDYHLMMAASTIRQKAEEENLRCKIGFFLHIPFPSWDIFRLFPRDDEVLQGMLGCDMIGFHIVDYCLNFIDCCQRRLGCRVDRSAMLVEHGGRCVRVRPLPIGIPFDRFVQLAKDAPQVLTATNQKLILGVDRLDYTKGLVHRLRAFERLLEKHPEYKEKVALLQIAVPSRTDVKEYQELKEDLDQLVGRINGRFTTPNWSPIRDSAVALVTPLRDGMNLVAKEFVACQIKEPGVLILSPFAGAGEMMHEALSVNPYELDDAAEVLHRALSMPKDEREVRMSHLRKRERTYDVDYWMKSFLKEMGSLTVEDGDEVLPTTMTPLTMDDFEGILSKYVGNEMKLALLLDYDGTLAPICPHPDLAVIPPEAKRVLERLANMSDVYVAVVSGRSVENVKNMVGINNITYAGNHGLEILHPDGTKFVHPMPLSFEEKVRTLLKELQEELCHDGAWVENKGAVLTFHYRDAPQNIRPQLISRATELMKKNGFIAGRGHCIVEAKPPVHWNKGRASIYILRTSFGVDWHERVRIIYAGDDVTDEDAIQALKGMAVTFRVTPSHTVRTLADRRLPSTDSVLMMLKWVERHLSKRKPRHNSLSRNTPPGKQILTLVETDTDKK